MMGRLQIITFFGWTKCSKHSEDLCFSFLLLFGLADLITSAGLPQVCIG